MCDDGWDLVCRLTKHRRVKGHVLRTSRRHPAWAETGRLPGGLQVVVVRDGAPYCATPRLTRPAVAVRRRSQVRSHSEEGIRVCKTPRGVTACQARSERAQPQPCTCGLIAWCVLEREGHDRGLTIDTRKRQLSGHGRMMVLPAREQLRQAA